MQIFSYLITEGKNPRIHLQLNVAAVVKAIEGTSNTNRPAVVGKRSVCVPVYGETAEAPIQPYRKYQFFYAKQEKENNNINTFRLHKWNARARTPEDIITWRKMWKFFFNFALITFLFSTIFFSLLLLLLLLSIFLRSDVEETEMMTPIVGAQP